MAKDWPNFLYFLGVFISHFVLCFTTMPGVQRKFEYKLSFKGPHLVQRDGTIPFWEHGGHAIASDESIRITPSLRSKKGQVWSKNQNTFEHWEVEATFRISGRGRVGADGLAIWYLSEKGTEGPVFGSNDKWNGLGVFFDSFDNDGQHNNPYIMAMVNDGTKSYDHNSDGQSQQLGGCLRDFRNKPYPVRARIEYYQKALTVFFHNGMTNNKESYELCLRVENVDLPPNGYFGVTAATGGLADDHDVSSFLTHSLAPPNLGTPGQEVPEEERKKFEEEFDQYHQKLQKAKEDYKQEHPDSHSEDEDEDEYYESQDVRELKMIFEGQNGIHNTMRQLHQRMDEVIGRQERTLSQISYLQQAGGAQQPPPTGGQQGAPAQLPHVDTIKRHEVETVLNTQRELQQSMRELRSVIGDIQSRTVSLGSGSAGSGNKAAGYDGTAHYTELKNSVNTMHQELRGLANKPPPAPQKCPTVTETSCVTTFYLFMFFILQIVIFLGYVMYRSSKEAAAKKFY